MPTVAPMPGKLSLAPGVQPATAPKPEKTVKTRAISKPALIRPRASRHHRRSWPVTLGAVGIIAAAILLRPGPVGTLTVRSIPAVPGVPTIDGERANGTGERIDVPAGAHRIGYEAEGWVAIIRQVTVRAGQARTVAITLTPAGDAGVRYGNAGRGNSRR